MLQQENRLAAFAVDDENVIASTLELILIHKGFDARAFIDPVEALHATRHVSPHLLLTDGRCLSGRTTEEERSLSLIREARHFRRESFPDGSG